MTEKTKQEMALWMAPLVGALLVLLISIIGWFGADRLEDIKTEQLRMRDVPGEIKAINGRLDDAYRQADKQTSVQAEVAHDVNNLDKRVSKLEDAALILHWPLPKARAAPATP